MPRPSTHSSPGARAHLEGLALLAVVSGYPYLQFWSNNVDEGVTAGSVLPAYLAAWAAFVACYLGLTLLASVPARRAAITSAALAMAAFAYPALAASLDPSLPSGLARIVPVGIIAVLVLFVAVAYALGQRPAISGFLALFAIARLGLPAWDLATRGATGAGPAVSAEEAWPLTDDRFWSGEAVRTPNIYWLILDSYPGVSVLRDFYQFDNRAFVGALEARGFNVAPDSHSNFNRTMFAMASALQMEVVFDEDTPYVAGQTVSQTWLPGRTQAGVAEALTGANRSVGFLSQLGYRYIHFDNRRWEIFRCRGHEDVCLEAPVYGSSELDAALARLLPWDPLRPVAWFVETIGTARPPSRVASATGIPDFIEVWNERPHLEASSPFFVYAHFPGLHFPYANAADCSRVENPGDSPRHLPPHLRCLNRQLQHLVDLILEDDPGAIVLIAGDHGPRHAGPGVRLDQLADAHAREWLSILTALRLPPECRDIRSTPTSPVNWMRIAFACLGGHAPRLSEDTHFLVETKSGQPDFGEIRRIDP